MELYDLLAAVHFQSPKPFPRPAELIERRQKDAARRDALIARYQARQKGAETP
jgi:hypothetical protein